MRERVAWIDTLRGMAILLVVLSHQDGGPFLKAYFFSFHVPLWFFVSGYLFPTEPAPDRALLVQRRWRRVIVPYFGWSLLTYPFWLVAGRHFGVDANLGVPWWQPLVGIFYGTGQGHWMLHNVPLWFLPCLFVTEQLFLFIHRLRNGTLIVAALLGFSLLGQFDARFVSFPLPWGLDVAFTAVVFYGIGHLVRRRWATDFVVAPARLLAIVIGALALQLFFISRNGPVNMNNQHQGNYLLFYIAALAGISYYFVLARHLKANRFLAYCGRNSLVILAAHTIGSSVTKGLVQFVGGVPIASTAGSPWWSLFFAGGSLLFCVPVVYLVNTRYPLLAGRAKTDAR